MYNAKIANVRVHKYVQMPSVHFDIRNRQREFCKIDTGCPIVTIINQFHAAILEYRMQFFLHFKAHFETGRVAFHECHWTRTVTLITIGHIVWKKWLVVILRGSIYSCVRLISNFSVTMGHPVNTTIDEEK